VRGTFIGVVEVEIIKVKVRGEAMRHDAIIARKRRILPIVRPAEMNKVEKKMEKEKERRAKGKGKGGGGPSVVEGFVFGVEEVEETKGQIATSTTWTQHAHSRIILSKERIKSNIFMILKMRKGNCHTGCQ